MYQVYESGSGKWVVVEGTKVKYVSNREDAWKSSISDLVYFKGLTDAIVYRNTMRGSYAIKH